jgi:hypothetical protein
MRQVVLLTVFMAALSACGDASTEKKSEAPEAATPISIAASNAATNPVCKIFAPDELKPYLGAAVLPPENATGGCQWAEKDGDGDVTISVVDARYHVEIKSDTYQPVSDVGTKGYSTQAMGGWQAGAIIGEQTVNVMIAGPAASREQAIALLKETVKRLEKI